MERQLYLSNGRNFGRKEMFPLFHLSQQKIYYILSFESNFDMAEAYISAVKENIPNDLTVDWAEHIKMLHNHFDYLDALRNFLAKNPDAEFYAE